MAGEVLTQDHPRWEEFLTALEGPKGCNFQYKIPNDVKSITWRCNGDKLLATAILENMGGFDVKETLSYFESCGGYCDCEILFNLR